MTTREDKISRIESDLSELKLSTVTQAVILDEIKNTLVIQTKTLQEFSTLSHRVTEVESKVDKLDESIERRKSYSNEKILSFENFRSSITGGIKVFVFVFTIIQCVIGYSVKSSLDELKQVQVEVRKVETKSAVHEDRLTRAESEIQKHLTHNPVAK